jgi:hypothetical protein
VADVLLPTWLRVARLRTDYADNTGMTRGLYTGAPETTSFGGDRLKLSLEFAPTLTSETDSAMERAALRSFLARLRGRQNRAYLWDPSYRQRGSFPSSELISNNTFASGTTGFTTSGGTSQLSVADRVLRSTITASGAAGNAAVRRASVTVTQYAPHVARMMVSAARFGSGSWQLALRDSGAIFLQGSATTTSPGILTQQFTPFESTLTYDLRLNTFTGVLAGDYLDVSYTSLSRCALVDNGLNSLLQSDELDATWTTSFSSVDDQSAGTTAPDGTSTADSIIEDSSTNVHRIDQDVTVSSSELDYCLGVALKVGTRTWARLSMLESTGATTVQAFFNLSTGAVGTTSTGANWANLRTFVVSLGNGWYACYIVGRKTSAGTTITARIALASADNTASYAGDGTSNIYAWRATLVQSSVPTRLIQTTTTASTGTDQTGSALYIKGLPASTSGLLLPDDRFEVITSLGSEMKIVTAALDSNAAGRGYLQFEPPLRGIPDDNAPVIFCNPMTKAIFAGEMAGWDDAPGIITTASAEFEEAV